MPANDERSGFRRWLDRRTGLDSLLDHALDEPIPGGAKIAYVFGSGLLFLFLSQIVTGVFLAMYYVPSADHAHTTVAYITKEETGGSFLRSIHAYGSSAIIIVLLLHLTQTLLCGSYKGRRDLVWLAGCVLLTLMLGMAFTGYLLPWDQKAYFATTVGTNILSEVPWVGNALTLPFAVFRVARVHDSGVHFCVRRHACLLIPKSRRCGTGHRRSSQPQ